MKEKGPKENRIRQNENLSKLDGFFWHGVFYKNGVARLPKEKQFPMRGEIRFKWPQRLKVIL